VVTNGGKRVGLFSGLLFASPGSQADALAQARTANLAYQVRAQELDADLTPDVAAAWHQFTSDPTTRLFDSAMTA